MKKFINIILSWDAINDSVLSKSVIYIIVDFGDWAQMIGNLAIVWSEWVIFKSGVRG